MSGGALEVDELTSWARRRDGGVDVVLRLPRSVLPTGPAEVRLTAGKARRRCDAVVRADGEDRVVDVRVEQARLGPTAWEISVRAGDTDRFRRVRARLLAFADHPVALLPGPTPATVLPAPAPRPATPLHRAAAALPPPVRSRVRRARDLARRGVRRVAERTRRVPA